MLGRPIVQFPCSPAIAESAYHFIGNLLKRNPANRLGFCGASEVKQHPFLDSVPFKEMAGGNAMNPPFPFDTLPGDPSQDLRTTTTQTSWTRSTAGLSAESTKVAAEANVQASVVLPNTPFPSIANTSLVSGKAMPEVEPAWSPTPTAQPKLADPGPPAAKQTVEADGPSNTKKGDAEAQSDGDGKWASPPKAKETHLLKPGLAVTAMKKTRSPISQRRSLSQLRVGTKSGGDDQMLLQSASPLAINGLLPSPPRNPPRRLTTSLRKAAMAR